MAIHSSERETDIDAASADWDQLRRRLHQRENVWAATVTLTGDPARLRPLRRDLVDLREQADRAFSRAMCMLETSQAAAQPRARAAR